MKEKQDLVTVLKVLQKRFEDFEQIHDMTVSYLRKENELLREENRLLHKRIEEQNENINHLMELSIEKDHIIEELKEKIEHYMRACDKYFTIE